jgi:hypothetical protein
LGWFIIPAVAFFAWEGNGNESIRRSFIHLEKRPDQMKSLIALMESGVGIKRLIHLMQNYREFKTPCHLSFSLYIASVCIMAHLTRSASVMPCENLHLCISCWRESWLWNKSGDESARKQVEFSESIGQRSKLNSLRPRGTATKTSDFGSRCPIQ